MALFGYAHVPWMKKHQKLLEVHKLPNSKERMEMAEHAKNMLIQSGYVDIGLDHFALPEDELTKALQKNELKRNFQGYTTDNATTLLAFGASSIGKLPEGYVQNKTSVKAYVESINAFALATEKGFELSSEDKMRAEMISELMCHYRLDFSKYPNPLNWRAEREKLQAMEKDGLLVLKEGIVFLTNKGKPWVRVVSSIFDTYFTLDLGKYSKAV